VFSNVEFFLVEALRSFRRGALMSFVAIGTITVSLVIFGMFLLLIVNLGNVIGTVSSKMDLAVYVDKDLSLEEAGALQVQLSKIAGVERVDFISRAEAWRDFQKEFSSKLDLSQILSENPLPHTFSLKIRTPELLPLVAKEVSRIPVISEVRYSGQLIAQIKSLVDAVRIGGVALVILISFATLLIVVNTVRFTVLARETDISIMKLVGATDTFVKWPFIIEGVLFGVIGGLLSALILKIAYEAVVLRVSSALPFFPVVSNKFMLTFIYLVMIIGGTLVGLLGAYISVSRVLKSEV